ncbi:GAF domain-containing protein [Candidatus Poribacteria bacterium]|nr:GAF domain-containing protein [Candidatus Poribacteria bacterium]
MDNLKMYGANTISPLSTEERLTIAPFLQRVNRESTLRGVLNCVEETFKEILPGSCLSIWLWDGMKQKVCRICDRLKPNCLAQLPPLLDATTPIGRWIGEGDDSDALVHTVNGETMGAPPCSEACRIAYLRARTVDNLSLLFTICLWQRQDFDDAFRQLISVLAQCAVHAIEKVRLKTEKDLLAEISNLANQSKSREDFLQQVVKAIRDAFSADGCTVLLHDKSKGKLVLGGTTGLVNPNTGEPLDYIEYELGEGLTGWIASHRRTMRLWDEKERLTIDQTGLIKSVPKSAEMYEGGLKGLRSFLGVPILLGPKDGEQSLIGVIRLLKKTSGIGFLPYDEQLLEVVCDVLAPAIERWNITTEMEREIALQRSLFDIIEAMHAHDDPDPDNILETIVNRALNLFGGYTCTVLLKEPNEDKLRVEKDVGHHQRMREEIVLDFSQGLCGYAARHRQTVAVPNVHQIPSGMPYHYYQVLEEVKSEICTPILFGDECLGVLDVASDREGVFRPEDTRTIRIIEAFAKQAAIALHRAQVMREREQWRQHLIRTTEMLTASNVASGLAHELKNGLAAISAMAQNLEPVPAIKVKPANRERLERIRKVSSDLFALASRLMDLSKVGEPAKRPVYLNEVIEEGIKLLEELVYDKKMKLVVDLDPELSRPPQGEGHQTMLDERQIQQVLTNLVLNAIDASRRGQRIEVRTRNLSPEGATFSVRDFGTGIAPDNKTHLFEMFFTTKPHGFGMGLAAVKILVGDNHGGKIDVDTKVGKGTTFTVHLLKLRTTEGGELQ